MPGRPASTCWVTSRWSVFSVRRTSCKLRPFSKKTGAERPFRQAGEMWCEQDSKRAKHVDMTASDLEITILCSRAAMSRRSTPRPSSRGSEHDRDRAVVDQLDRHPRAEDAGRDL